MEHAPKLQELFDRLVEAIIKARLYKKTHPDLVTDELPPNKQSDRFRVELNRILRIEGGQEVLERAQETGLRLLLENTKNP